MNEDQLVETVVREAMKAGFPSSINRNGQNQIDFGHKKLHEGHLREMFPEILKPDVNLSRLIESVAPGRPCTHRPMKEILSRMQATQ